MHFRPLHDRVLVRRIDAEEKTAGGIIIPDTAKEKPQEGEVIASGPAGAPRREARRPGAIRQMVWHGGQDRRQRTPHHEGERPAGRRREPLREEEGRVKR